MQPVDWEEFYLGNPNQFWQIPREILRKLIEDIGMSVSIMDVGCGDGSLLANLYQFGCDQLYGVDVSFEAVARARLRNPHAVIDQLDIENQSISDFDMIFCHLVLPFLTRKTDVFRKLVKSSKRLIITIPILTKNETDISQENIKAMTNAQIHSILSSEPLQVERLLLIERTRSYRNYVYLITSNVDI